MRNGKTWDDVRSSAQHFFSSNRRIPSIYGEKWTRAARRQDDPMNDVIIEVSQSLSLSLLCGFQLLKPDSATCLSDYLQKLKLSVSLTCESGSGSDVGSNLLDPKPILKIRKYYQEKKKEEDIEVHETSVNKTPSII